MRLAHRLITLAAALALLALPSAATAKDHNHDRIPDRWEKRHRLSTKVNQAHRDQDRDHLRNRAEFLAGDNPRDRDSDDDGTMDGDENAGTIESFDAATGRLTIALFGGDSISGLVDNDTEIECEHSETTATASHDGSDDPSGEDERADDHGDDEDNSGPGSTSSGPGHEGEDEHGDCDRNDDCTVADLVPGAVVEEAELRLSDGVATFEEVELGS